MKKLIKTAKILTTIFDITNIILTIAFVLYVFGFASLITQAIFRDFPSPADMLSTVELGFISLQFADPPSSSVGIVLIWDAVWTILGAVCILLCKRAVSYILQVLRPMTVGKPFHAHISNPLKKLGLMSIVLGIVSNFISISQQILLVHQFDLTTLLHSDKFSGVTVNYTAEPTFLIISAVLFLLSYIFRYGEELQQQADETL